MMAKIRIRERASDWTFIKELDIQMRDGVTIVLVALLCYHINTALIEYSNDFASIETHHKLNNPKPTKALQPSTTLIIVLRLLVKGQSSNLTYQRPSTKISMEEILLAVMID